MTPASDVFNTDRSQAPKRTRRRLAAGIAVIVILPSLMVLSAVRTVRPVAASGSNTYYTTDIAPTNPVIHFTMNSNGGTTWAPRAPLPSDGDGLCSTWPGYDPAEYSDRQGHVYGTRTSGENGVVGGSCMPQNAMPSPLPNDSEENQGTLQPDAGGSSASPGLLGTTLPTFASCAGGRHLLPKCERIQPVSSN